MDGRRRAGRQRVVDRVLAPCRGRQHGPGTAPADRGGGRGARLQRIALAAARRSRPPPVPDGRGLGRRRPGRRPVRLPPQQRDRHAVGGGVLLAQHRQQRRAALRAAAAAVGRRHRSAAAQRQHRAIPGAAARLHQRGLHKLRHLRLVRERPAGLGHHQPPRRHQGVPQPRDARRRGPAGAGAGLPRAVPGGLRRRPLPARAGGRLGFKRASVAGDRGRAQRTSGTAPRASRSS